MGSKLQGHSSCHVMMAIRAARYDENMGYAITLLNIAITILLVLNKQIVKCTNFCISAALSILLNTTNSLFNLKQVKGNHFQHSSIEQIDYELNIKGTT